MERFLTIFLCALALHLPASAQKSEKKTEPALDARPRLPSCTPLLEFRLLCERMREAQARVAAIPLRFLQTTKNKEQSIEREFALVAYDVGHDTLHTLILSMPIVAQPDFQPKVLTVHDPPYRVRRIKGLSYNKMMFEVWSGDRELFVLAGKHLSVNLSEHDRSLAGLSAKARPIVYLSGPSYLLNEEFAEAGRQFLRSVLLRETLERLRELRIPSRAFPGKQVADVKAVEDAMAIIVAEHADHCLLPKRDPGCSRLVPQPIFRTYDEVVQSVFVEFMVNGDQAFSHLSSTKDALGVAQFTNKWNGDRPGTYDLVRKRYPEANLDPDFVRGSKDFHNSTMALLLLLDLELSQERLPQWVRAVFAEDPRVGRLIPGAAYNGGTERGVQLSRLLEEFRRVRRIDHFLFEAIPWEEFLHFLDSRPTALNPETRGYVRKMVDTERFFSRNFRKE